MRLTAEQVAKLQKLYREVLGQSICKEEALQQGLALVRMVKNTALPKPKQNYNEQSPSKTHR